MKTTTFISAIIFLTATITSCTKDDITITPSGNITSVTRTVGGFSQLEVSDAFSAYVFFADAEENVRIEANSNLQPYIHVDVHGDRLSIWLDDAVRIVRGEAVLNLYITAYRIESVTAGGAVYVEMADPWQGDALDIHLDGASVLSGVLNAAEIDAELTGSSVMLVGGTAGTFHIDATGASHMEDFGFQAGLLKAHLTGASSAQLTVHDELRVTASGASSVIYRGNGVVTKQELSGASTILRVN